MFRTIPSRFILSSPKHRFENQCKRNPQDDSDHIRCPVMPTESPPGHLLNDLDPQSVNAQENPPKPPRKLFPAQLEQKSKSGEKYDMFLIDLARNEIQFRSRKKSIGVRNDQQKCRDYPYEPREITKFLHSDPRQL